MKRCLIFVLMLLLTLSVLGISVSNAEELPSPRVVKGRPFLVAFISLSLGAESAQRDYRQSKIEAAARGFTWLETTGHDTPAAQREAFGTLLQRNPDAIVIVYVNLPSIEDYIIQARKKGIGVYCIDSSVGPGIVMDSTQPNGVAGCTVLYWGANRFEKKATIAFTNCPAPCSWMCRERTIPARAIVNEEWVGMTNYGTYEYSIEAWATDNYNIGTTLADKYGDKLNWVFGNCDPSSVFVAKGLMAGGITRDETIVTGIDGGSEAFNMIRTGTPFIATYAQPFEAYAHNVFEAIEQIQIEGIPPYTEKSIVPKSRVMYEIGMMIDPTNVPIEGTTVYEAFNYFGENPDDPDSWVNYYKKVGMEPYTF